MVIGKINVHFGRGSNGSLNKLELRVYKLIFLAFLDYETKRAFGKRTFDIQLFEQDILAAHTKFILINE